MKKLLAFALLLFTSTVAQAQIYGGNIFPQLEVTGPASFDSTVSAPSYISTATTGASVYNTVAGIQVGSNPASGTLQTSFGNFNNGTIRTGIRADTGDNLVIYSGSTAVATGTVSTGIVTQSGYMYGWASTGNPLGTVDTTLCRLSAGTVEANSGTGCGSSGSIKASVFSTGAPVTVAASTYTVLTTDSYIIVNNAGTCTVTMPTASSFTGRQITIKTITANTVVSNASNVVPETTATPGTAILAGTAGKWARLVSDGSNWIIMESN